MIQRLLMRVVVIAAIALSVSPATAQNVIRLRIDTVTADPGATVDVRVLYTFTSTHAYDIHDYNARFLFDTSKSKLVAYVLNGTASANLSAPNDTIGSHVGILESGNGQEIDLTDSVLFIIRMKLDSNADTAWIRWDSNFYHGYGLAVFGAGDEGIDSVTQEDGWIRTTKQPASVNNAFGNIGGISMYPNPAYDQVTINVPGSSDHAVIEVYDEVGRLAYDGPLVLNGWQIPPELRYGAYEIVLTDASRKTDIGTLIIAPQ